MSNGTDQDLKNTIGILEQVLERNGRKEELEELRKGKNIVVVRGEYDHIETVLEVLGVPYNIINQEKVNQLDFCFNKADTVFINCAGSVLDRSGISRIREYVEYGGRLVTTDWAVEQVVKKAFPETIRRLGTVTTKDDVVSIQPQGDLGKRLVGLDYEGANPKWWLEGQSYPIEVLNSEIVVPMIKSEELEKKYGSPYIAVAFPWGRGAVLHFVSHIKAQRTEVRDQRDQGTILHFARMTQTVVPKKVEPSTTTVAGMETGYSTLSTVFEILTQDPKKWGSVVSSKERGHSQLELFAKGYPSVHFTNQKESDGIFALYDLKQAPVNIGRGSHNDIDLGDNLVSRNHAKMFYDGAKCHIKDLESTNGVLVGNLKVSQAQLKTGDVIRIGSGTLEIKFRE